MVHNILKLVNNRLHVYTLMKLLTLVLELLKTFSFLPTHKNYRIWRLICDLFLVYFLITFPLRLAFGNDKDIFTRYIIADSVMDLLYLIDMMIKFFVATEIRGEYISDRKIIAKEYLTGFFWLDLISVLPYQLFAPPGVQIFKMLRVIYVLPILDLWTQIPKYLINTFGRGIIIPSLATFVGSVYFYLTVMVFFLHAYACIFIAIGDPHGGNEGWVLNLTNYQYTPESFAKGSLEVYLSALYFVVTTFTTVGYGDVLPSREREYVFVMFIQFFGVAQFGIAVSQVLNYSATFKTEEEQDNDEIEELTDFIVNYDRNLERANLPPRPFFLAKVFQILKLRVYHNWGDLFLHNEFYNSLLTSERYPLSKTLFAPTCELFKTFFGGLELNFVNEIIPHFFSRMYFKLDLIIGRGEIPKGVFFIREGTVLVLCRDKAMKFRVMTELKTGDFFGEDCLISDKENHFVYLAKYEVKLYLIEKHIFVNFSKHHKNQMEKLKGLAYERHNELLKMKRDFLKTIDPNDNFETVYTPSPQKKKIPQINIESPPVVKPNQLQAPIPIQGQDNSVLITPNSTATNKINPYNMDPTSAILDKIGEIVDPKEERTEVTINKQDVSSASQVKIDPKKPILKQISTLGDKAAKKTPAVNLEQIVSPTNRGQQELAAEIEGETQELKELAKPKEEEEKPAAPKKSIFNFLGRKIVKARSEISEESDVTDLDESDQAQSASEEEESASDVADQDGYMSEIYPLEAVKPNLNDFDKIDSTIEFFQQKVFYLKGKIEIMKRKTQYKTVQVQRLAKSLQEKHKTCSTKGVRKSVEPGTP